MADFHHICIMLLSSVCVQYNTRKRKSGSSASVYYTECNPKNTKWGRPGNEAGNCTSCKKCSQVAVFIPYVTCSQVAVFIPYVTCSQVAVFIPYVTCIWGESCYSQKRLNKKWGRPGSEAIQSLSLSHASTAKTRPA